MKFGDSVPISIIISNCILCCATAWCFEPLLHCGLAHLGSRHQELLHTVGSSSEIIPQFCSAGDVQAGSAVLVMFIILHRALELRLPFQTNLHLMDILLPGPQLQPGWSPFYCFPGLGFLKVSHTSKDDVWRLLSLACFIQHNDLQLRSACWKWQDFVSFGSYILLFGIGSTFSLFLHLLMDTGWFHIFTIVITALAKYLGAHPKDFSYLRKLTWVNFNF